MKDYIDYFANYVGCSPDESGFIMYRPYLEGRYVEDKTPQNSRKMQRTQPNI